MGFTKEERKYFKRHIQEGNLKLPKTTAIFNLGSATNCPNRLNGNCSVAKECYALNPEKRFPDVIIPYRERQRELFTQLTAEKFVSMFLDIQAKKRSKFETLRFNEAGDFSSQEDIEKVDRIAELLEPHGIKTYAYSCSKDLDFSGMTHCTLNSSHDDIKGHNRFKAVRTFSGDNLKCLCDCSTCKTCQVKTGKIIEVIIH